MNKFHQGIFVGCSVGVLLGFTASSSITARSMNEIDLIYKSMAINSGIRSHTLYSMLHDEKYDPVKKSLLDECREAKIMALMLDVEQLSKDNWPFVVDENFVTSLKNSVKNISNLCGDSAIAVSDLKGAK